MLLHKEHGSTSQVALGGVVMSLLIAVPLSVHAGLFAAVFAASSDVINTESTAVSVSAVDTPLLTAAQTVDPQASRGGGDVFVQDGALLPGGAVGEDIEHNAKQNTGQILIYEVREGDTLSQIAEMFDVNSNTILWANDLGSSKDIHPGDSLLILPIVGVQHVVKTGDTVASIAKKYDADADEIRSYNHITDNDLKVGMTVMVPGGNMHEVAVTTTTKSSSSSSATSVSTRGYFTIPLVHYVKTQSIHGYNAVDLAASVGEPVMAAAAGQVIVSKSGGWNGGYGSYIVIKHANGTQTLYAHLSANAVGVGAYVTTGEVIGAVGNTGRSTGPHLHFEVRGGVNPF